MPRLFIAIDLPEPVRRAAAAICTGLPDLRWTRPEQLHLTLIFLGEVEAERCGRITAALAGIRFAPFPLQLSGVGCFPTPRRPRVLWGGVADNPVLLELQHQLAGLLAGYGYQPEARTFHPHLTLARLPMRYPPGAVADYLDRHRAFRADPFTVGEFRLYSSVLTPRRAIHRVEASYPAIT